MRKVLFLDRDGVINVDAGYVHSPREFVFIDGIFDFCSYAVRKGYDIIVVTNQSGIGRGMFTEDDFRATTEFMSAGFQNHGITITDVFHCPDLESEDRKPNPGMFIKAQLKWDIDMANSVSVGDRARDVEAGCSAGVGRNILFTGDFRSLYDVL